MITTIFYIIIALSLIGLGIILYRKVPVLANLSEEEMMILIKKRGAIEKAREVNYKHHWLNFIVVLQKFLMRIRILFLKSESTLGKWIGGLRNNSKVMTQKSKEWIRQREMKRKEKQNNRINGKGNGEVILKINKEIVQPEPEERDEEITIDELNKPIKEEQQWIDLIVENPKNITAYKFLGLFYYKQHNYSDAKASLEMAIKLGSKDKKLKEILAEIGKMRME